MSITEKGKKGFQSVNTEERKSERIVSYLSKKELYNFKEYCDKNNLKTSVVIRELILSLNA